MEPDRVYVRRDESGIDKRSLLKEERIKNVEEIITEIKSLAEKGDAINANYLQQGLESGQYGKATDDQLKDAEEIIADLSWRIIRGEKFKK